LEGPGSSLARSSSAKKVLVTRTFPGPIKETLKQFELNYREKDENLSYGELKSLVRDKHGILCSIPDKIDKEILMAAKNLQVVSTFSVGYDHIDVKEATERGIAVTNTPDVLTDATADLTFALLLGIARRIAEGHDLVMQRRWKEAWSPKFMLGSDLAGKKLGILGMGRIGRAVAKRAAGFGMEILYHSRHRLLDERIIGAKNRTFDQLLKESDFLSIHVPLSKETYHLIDGKRLAMMKKTAFLINTARGPIVDEDALYNALKKKRIAGAALDVFEREPLPENSPLLTLKNILLTPHMGSAAEAARYKMGEVAGKNLADVLLGKIPLYLVNPEYVKHG